LQNNYFTTVHMVKLLLKPYLTTVLLKNYCENLLSILLSPYLTMIFNIFSDIPFTYGSITVVKFSQQPLSKFFSLIVHHEKLASLHSQVATAHSVITNVFKCEILCAGTWISHKNTASYVDPYAE
jgi:uncharacterized membrane protein YccF (DUF307 family)